MLNQLMRGTLASACLSGVMVVAPMMPAAAHGKDDKGSSGRGLELTDFGNRTFGGVTIGDPRVGSARL